MSTTLNTNGNVLRRCNTYAVILLECDITRLLSWNLYWTKNEDKDVWIGLRVWGW